MEHATLGELVKLNKRCCDCGMPGPVFANLSFGTLVCPECAHALRELGFQVKSLGYGNIFQEELLVFFQSGGNQQVNDVFLERLGDEGIGSPTLGGSRSQADFLRRKYVERVWCDPVRVAAAAAGLLPQPKSTKRFSPSSPIIGNNNHTGAGMSPISLSQRKRPSLLSFSRPSSNRWSSSSSQQQQRDETKEEQFDSLYEQIRVFYTAHNPDKLERVGEFTEWALTHGMDAFEGRLQDN
ncbi:hypothetical protein BASA81_002700 [Batrachochytrium salamandrivorans]|nr:hypothetical protein BASA81_002700 [Batrachochytrium salamandrivorans]